MSEQSIVSILVALISAVESFEPNNSLRGDFASRQSIHLRADATPKCVSQPSSTYDLHHGRHEARQPPLPPQPHMATLAADKLSNLQAAPSISCASYIHIIPRASAAR
jgi:hypothetical protein